MAPDGPHSSIRHLTGRNTAAYYAIPSVPSFFFNGTSDADVNVALEGISTGHAHQRFLQSAARRGNVWPGRFTSMYITVTQNEEDKG